jgi:hypothetical protein
MAAAAELDGSNYVYLEFGLQMIARRLWQTRGKESLHRVVETLRGPARSKEEVIAMLGGLDPAVGRAMNEWPNFTF